MKAIRAALPALAARFFDRSTETQIFKRGMDAHDHPTSTANFIKTQMEFHTTALRLLARKFNLT